MIPNSGEEKQPGMRYSFNCFLIQRSDSIQREISTNINLYKERGFPWYSQATRTSQPKRARSPSHPHARSLSLLERPFPSSVPVHTHHHHILQPPTTTSSSSSAFSLPCRLLCCIVSLSSFLPLVPPLLLTTLFVFLPSLFLFSPLFLSPLPWFAIPPHDHPPDLPGTDVKKSKPSPHAYSSPSTFLFLHHPWRLFLFVSLS
ncbi:hypothetical protein BDV59DRAFT_40317 [Aspergillus ambiguus]|uniref:uncharacterized protein n=1 Tax=Aspergillus ambiguus TaxID=176160 RepID=UPI003CCD8D79